MTEDLNIVLARYEEAIERSGGTALKEWTERYPQHAVRIAEYALDSYLLERGCAAGPDADADALFMERARLVRERMRAAEPHSLRSLLEAARSRGLTAAEAARKIGIGLALWTKLDRRLVLPAGVPVALVERIAIELGRRTTDVVDYLRQPPTLSAAASYKATAAPRVRQQEDFVLALETCPGMSEEERQVWRSELGRTIGGER